MIHSSDIRPGEIYITRNNNIIRIISTNKGIITFKKGSGGERSLGYCATADLAVKGYNSTHPEYFL